MFWLLKDVGGVLLGLAGLYLLCFGVFPDREKDESDESRQVRVWMTYVALAVLSVGALAWAANYVIHRL